MAQRANEEPKQEDFHDSHNVPAKEEQAKPSKPAGSKHTAKEEQAIRDAHFKENGVKADGTGGKVPGSES